jgi:hypothetical protein
MTTPPGPRSGDGTCDLIGEALCRLHEPGHLASAPPGCDRGKDGQFPAASVRTIKFKVAVPVSDRRQSLRISADLSRGRGCLSGLLPGFDPGACAPRLPPASPEKQQPGRDR